MEHYYLNKLIRLKYAFYNEHNNRKLAIQKLILFENCHNKHIIVQRILQA